MKWKLLCEGLENPAGIDTPTPELSWYGPEEGIGQTACRIRLWKKGIPSWDSGWLDTADSRYQLSADLEEKCGYSWQVTVKKGNGEEESSEEAAFSTGIFEGGRWDASFITGGTLLRKEVEIDGDIASAFLSFTGLGYCEAYVNGRRVGRDVLFPSYTVYEKTVEYTVKDVAAMLKKGRNVIGLMLGGHWDLDEKLHAKDVYSQAFYRGQCMGICQLDLEMEDGSRTVVGSDASWQVSRSPITFSSVFDGEHYDARLEQPGWCTAEFDASGWGRASVCSPGTETLRYSYIPPIRVTEEISVKTVCEKDGDYILDFGQNFAGWIRLWAEEESGREIRIRYGETLYEDGTMNTENLRNAKATDVYICKGNGRECYEPRFTYHGFRFVQISGLSELTAEDVTGRAVHTDNTRIADFSCSNEDFNRIYRAMVWTMRSNMHSIPTDCCQRDERQGWLADAGVSSEFGVLNFDLQHFYRKWFQDIRDTQQPDGSLPLAGAPGWPRDTFIWKIGYHMTLRSLYLYTGDRRTVMDNYGALKKYESYMHSTLVDGLIPYDFYNDWLAIEFADNLMIANSYFVDFYNAMILFAEVAGDEEGLSLFQKRREELVDKMNEKFYGWCLDSPLGTGYYGTCDTMAAAPEAMALEYGIVPEKLQEKVEDVLLWQLTKSRGSIQFPTGILTSGILVDCLAHRGHDEVAYRLLDREDYPSLRFMLSHGATTIWERWQYLVGNEMNSHNHPALCSLGAWFFKSLCGLRQIRPMKDGTAEVKLRPFIPEDMENAGMNFRTHWGVIRLEWVKKDRKVEYLVKLPERIRGTVVLPGGEETEVCAGENVFMWEYDKERS